MSNIVNSTSHTPTMTSPGGQPNPAMYDISDPLFNLDLTSLNFVNQYGPLELGMLGHMSSGVSEPSMKDMSMTTPSIDSFPGSAALPGDPLYHDVSNQSNVIYGGGLKSRLQWQHDPYAKQGVSGQVPSNKINLAASAPEDLSIPLGFTINTGSDDVLELISALDSTETAGSGAAHDLQQPHTTLSHVAKQQTSISQPGVSAAQPQAQDQTPREQQQRSVCQEQTDISDTRLNTTLSTFHTQNTDSRKRRLDASSVYETVKKPYSYINGFHSLIIFLQKNFSRQKMSRIAKALASIRPSFIACTQHLNGLDLVYMEKCFQRTLCEYEDFINKNCTPTIICRRTGEIAAVSREFTSLTGWRMEVLLGKEPNRNIRLGSHNANDSLDGAGAGTGTGTGTGTSDSHMKSNNGSSGSNSGSGQSPNTQPETTTVATQQPVFLAELLDEDSVIRFYEDFAHVAFSDSRGSVMTPCKLLKYRTKDYIARNDATTKPASTKASNTRSAATSSDRNTLGSDKINHPRNHGFSKSYADPHIQNSRYEDSSNDSSNCSTANTSMADISMTNNDTVNLSFSPTSKSMPSLRPGNLIPGESDLRFLDDDKGRVDCMLCWTIKRDMFEVPMLIVMNVSL